MSPAAPIRLATLADIPRLMEIRAAVKENILSDPSKVTLADYEWFIGNNLVWVWDEGATIKGLSAGDVRDGSVWALFIDPPYERQGIGRVLFAAACRTLTDAGHAELRLYTGAGTRAADFYRAAGWRESPANEKGEIIFTLKTAPVPGL